MKPEMWTQIMFESDVISDGTQIAAVASSSADQFESDVISDGTQIRNYFYAGVCSFESDVISDGTQIMPSGKEL